ncbi:MAG: hypothetical protein KJN76_00770, partial [Eudoraea sp.]|nr:hypothetical protein [Eudoraea sp.]
MLIQSKAPRNRNKIVLWSAIAILLLLALNAIIQNKGDGLKNILGGKNNTPAAGDKTEVASLLYTEDLLTDTVNRVYQRENLTLYLNNELGAPTLMAVYKDSLSELEENGRFLVFLYLKDPSKWRSVNKKWDHILLTKEQLIPITKVVDNTPHYIFKFRLEHPYFNIENLKELEFVRHTREFGRFEEVRINPDSVGLIYPISNTLDKLQISVSKKRMQKITDKRNHALESGILITNDDDFVNATITTDGKEAIKANMRLKGDWTDHLEHPSKWSYRIVPVGEQTVFGMRKFSVQHPKSRNYLWEWLFNKVVKDNDLIGLRYDFLNVTLNITDTDSIIPMGIMALEESFDKILIENNRRREGLILGFDESGMWDERKQLRDLSLDLTRDLDLPKANELPVKVYNENKTLSSPVLSRQFTIAKNLILGLRDGELELSEAFDVDKLTTYIALSNLFGGHHGLHIENIRIYYNPVTNKLEPVSFDSNSGYPVSFLRGYPIGIRDAVFEEKLVEKYEQVSSTEFISGFIRKYEEALNVLALNLSGEFDEASIDFSVLQHNANLIKKKILPANIIDATLLSYDNSGMEVEIKNLSEFTVVVEDLVLANKKSLNENNTRQLIPPKDTLQIKFQLKKSFNNAFVSKKNKEGGFRYPKDLSKITLSHHISGSEHKKYKPIRAFNSNFEATVVNEDRPKPH